MVISDRENYEIMRTPNKELPQDIKGVGEELYQAMIRHKDKIAQIDAETGDSEIFSSFLERSIRVAVNLRRMGITQEDILTPCTDNHLNTAVAFVGILFTGAKVSAIDPCAPDEDRMKQLSLLKPKIMFCSVNALERATKLIEALKLDSRIIVFGEVAGFMSFDELLIPRVDDEKRFSPYIPKDLLETAMIVFSSGTTGIPHGVCMHNYAFLSMMYGGRSFTFEENDCREQSTVLTYSSLVWISGIAAMCCGIFQGNIRIVASIFTPEKTWRYLDKYKVSAMMLVSCDLVSLINNERPKGLNISSLKTILAGGVPISGDAVRRVKAALPGVSLSVGYSLTELGKSAFMIKFDDSDDLVMRKPGSIGLMRQGIEGKIVDPDTEELLGPNQAGEFRVKSPTMMNGYYNEDASSRYDSDGFLKTGDILYYDEEGYFYFVERLKDVLSYNLCVINPTELEGILQEYPGVELAVLIGLPSDGGDLPVAVIVRSEENVKADDLHEFVSERVDERKRLHGGIIFVERSYIPFTASGKVQKRKLKALISKDRNVECKQKYQ